MGRLRKVSHEDVPIVSSVESDDSLKDPFVPNDFADDASNAMSMDCSGEDAEFDKALYNFYVNNRQKRSSDLPNCSTFTRYSGKFFSGVVDGLCPRYKGVIEDYGMGCLLRFVRTEVPLRLVKRLASRFDVSASEFQLKRKFIPLTKYDLHDILDLPVDGEPLVCDPESGHHFILSHFNLSSIPPVSFFANKLKCVEVDLPDEDVFICFMIVAFSTFLCPNSSLSPSSKYFHIFQDCRSVCSYDLSRRNKVKQFAKLDRNNSRSFGKRPLKRLRAPTNLQGSIGKTISSKSVYIGPSDGTFALKVQKSIGPRFGSQASLDVIELVESRNQDKPKIFLEWSESLVLDVLDCILHSSFPKVSASENQSMSKFSFGNKSVSIHSAIANREFVKAADVLETEVQQESHHLPSPATAIVPPPVPDGGIENPVVISSCSVPDKVHAETVVTPDIPVVRSVLCEVKLKGSTSFPLEPPTGNYPSNSKCGNPDVDSVVVLSDGTPKEKVGVNAFGIPSFVELNRSLGIQSPTKACNGTPVSADKNSAMEDGNSFSGLSPLIPVRLSQLFRNELPDVQCSRYVADRFLKTFDSSRSEDCLVMVNVPSSAICKSKEPVNEAGVDVHKVGSSRFNARCQELSRSNDVAYNKLHNFAPPATSRSNHIEVPNSPEVDLMLVKPAVASSHLSEVVGCSIAAPSCQFPGASTETILDGNNPEIVANAFNGANSAFAMWTSNLLFFPICRFKRWFSFVVCLKERVFAFLDSFYGQYSDFHMEIRDKMVNNFINLWDMFVSPIMRKRIDFKSFGIVYPVVPQQTNADDFGVFSVMYMKHWSPRTPIGNLFSSADIDNIRIKLANELYFSPSNSADKSFVTNFFGDVQN
ncbi:hypothetical protein D1007_54487 [Hordeum vulgare]|nr:hypothetical protein D1007_54487 [Hordeum vulgare]